MPVEMYKMKPFYSKATAIEIPKVMYSIKSYHEVNSTDNKAKDQAPDAHSLDTVSTADSRSALLDSISALELRQEAILSRLAKLQDTLHKICGQKQAEFSTCLKPRTPKQESSNAVITKTSLGQTVKSSSVPVKSPLGPVIHDIVIHADPASPPLSIFIFFEMLKQKYTVFGTTYVHSSVSIINPRLLDIIKNDSQALRGSHQVALILIWKKVENGPELIVSPIRQSALTREVNIARYINRLLSPAFDTEDIILASQIDEWLDLADNQLMKGNSRQKASAVKLLNATLESNEWVVGNEFSFVDVVLWSCITELQGTIEVDKSLQRWMKACSSLPWFENVVNLI